MALSSLGNFEPKKAGPGGYEKVYIDHKSGKLVSSEAKSTFVTKIKSGRGYRFVGLGLIRQREFWHERDNGRKKVCVSKNGDTGLPGALFPWHESNITQPQDQLDCAVCPFRQWQDGQSPQCQVKWYIPIMSTGINIKDDWWMNNDIVILTMTQSGVTAFKNFWKAQPSRNTFLFRNELYMTMNKRMNGDRTYVAPEFELTGTYFDTSIQPILNLRFQEVKKKIEDETPLTAQPKFKALKRS